MLAPKHFLVFYKDDYIPEVYLKANIELYHYNYTKEKLSGIFPTSKIKEWHSYYIVTNL